MPNILVIDSDPASRAALVHALAGLGVVEHTGNSLDALRTLATTTFSVIVLDLRARPLDGFLVLRALATKGGPNRATPIYALAADTAEQDRALQAHAVFVVIKPVSLATMKILVEARLSRPPPTDESPSSPRVAKTPPQRPSPSSPPAKTSGERH